jgi:tyrosinase
MGDPISAGFDPIFMLHHTNVDRQLALWQTLHDVWIGGTASQQDLRPFWKSNTQFHRSIDAPVRDFTQFRATYPEFVGLEKLTPAQRKAAIQKAVDALYKPRGLPGLLVSAASSSRSLDAPPSEARLAAPNEGERSAPPDDDEVRLDWLARVRVKKFQFKTSFNVIVFLGEVPEHVEQYLSAPGYVGTHSEFVNSAPEHCGSCSENADIITEGVVNLNNALERKGYEHKSEEEIKQYIKKNIRWRVQKIDGSLVPINEVDILEVAVATWDVTTGDLHAPLVYHNITSEKDGGYKPGNQPYHL